MVARNHRSYEPRGNDIACQLDPIYKMNKVGHKRKKQSDKYSPHDHGTIIFIDNE